MKSFVKAATEAIAKSLENNDSKNVTLQKREKRQEKKKEIMPDL